MPIALRTEGSHQLSGAVIAAQGFEGPTRRSDLPTENGVYGIPFSAWRVWDALATPLGTAANDDLGISDGSTATYGVFATGTPFVRSRDLNGLGTLAGYARTIFTLPPEYVAGGTITLRMACGCLTGAASSVDADAYLSGRATLISGSNLVTTAAQNITGTFGNVDFTITPTNRAPGDQLDIRIAVIGTTVAVATVVAIPHVELVLQIKG